MNKQYLFKSARLGFRNWLDSDIPEMTEINSDADVMEFFPEKATLLQTEEFIGRMKKMYSEKGYCYFAADKLDDGSFIGFIGLCEQTYGLPFTPCVDIGWRLNKKFWNQGYAAEGAFRCLEYAFIEIKLKNIKSIAPVINLKSIKVMEKIGMKKYLEFKHPKLAGNKRLENCVCYQIENE